MRLAFCVTLVILATGLSSFAQETKPSGTNSLLTASFYDRVGRALHSPKKTTPVGSHTNGNDFSAIPSESAVLVGLAVKKGDWFGTPIISALQPIYENQTHRFRGEIVGKKGSDVPLVVEAKPGYVVTQLVVSAPHDHVHGIKLIFRKIDFLHQGVDANDSYESEWLGIEFQNKSQKVGDVAHAAIGLNGRADEWVASVGLLQIP